jgi:hypothetical protein
MNRVVSVHFEGGAELRSPRSPEPERLQRVAIRGTAMFREHLSGAFRAPLFFAVLPVDFPKYRHAHHDGGVKARPRAVDRVKRADTK